MTGSQIAEEAVTGSCTFRPFVHDIDQRRRVFAETDQQHGNRRDSGGNDIDKIFIPNYLPAYIIFLQIDIVIVTNPGAVSLAILSSSFISVYVNLKRQYSR